MLVVRVCGKERWGEGREDREYSTTLEQARLWQLSPARAKLLVGRKGEIQPVFPDPRRLPWAFLFTGIWKEEKKKKKAQPDHASKILGASTTFLRAVPPQRQERLTLKAIKYLGYFRITP